MVDRYMSQIKLLDCTLRDGGFVNDWNFGHGDIINIFERLVSAKVDIIEVGFLDDRRPFDINRTILPDTEAVNRVFRDIRKRPPMVVGMIDYGTCTLENVCDCADSFLDGIRVIFKKKDAVEALAFCRAIQEKGYKVFVQPVSVTGYSDQELSELVDRVNELEPYSMSVVDTYGLLHKNNLFHYFQLLNDRLLPSVGVGYHSHNNFQLAYSNSIELMGLKIDRLLVIDGSVYGMGKGAGNANLELLAMYMNDHCGKDYDINQMLEIIDVNIMQIFLKTPWGYSMRYYLAALNDCHPMYVQYLLQKRTLSTKSVNEILRRLRDEERLAFNEAHVEELYRLYQTRDIDDGKAIAALGELLRGQEVLILGPGKSVMECNGDIADFAAKTCPKVIAINYLPKGVAADYVFVSNGKRYVPLSNQLASAGTRARTIATSNVACVDGEFDFTVDYSKLLDPDFFIIDNSLLMLLKLLAQFGVGKVALAGFDGYRANAAGCNYLDMAMEYSFSEEKAAKVNSFVVESLKEMRKKMEIRFVTPSLYEV